MPPIDNNFLNACKTAKSLYPQFQYYPLLGELVFLEDLPSPASQISNTSTQKYYISSINLWNNQQQNSATFRHPYQLALTNTHKRQEVEPRRSQSAQLMVG